MTGVTRPGRPQRVAWTDDVAAEVCAHASSLVVCSARAGIDARSFCRAGTWAACPYAYAEARPRGGPRRLPRRLPVHLPDLLRPGSTRQQTGARDLRQSASGIGHTRRGVPVRLDSGDGDLSRTRG